MGVYIKGMTIEQLRRMGVAGIILSEYRLVEVKEPHGRLADIDELMRRGMVAHRCDECPSSKENCFKTVRYSRGDICRWVDNSPVIIEAEE